MTLLQHSRVVVLVNFNGITEYMVKIPIGPWNAVHAPLYRAELTSTCKYLRTPNLILALVDVLVAASTCHHKYSFPTSITCKW